MDDPSVHFYYVKPRWFGAAVLSILMIVIVILVLYILIYLTSKVKKPCTAAPSAPTGVGAGYISSSDFRVLWNPVPNVEKYTVYVGQTPSFNRVHSVKIVTTNTSQAEVLGLTEFRTYYIYVTASNSCGESENSQEITFVFVQA